MSVSGLCSVCESASAEARCDRCGAIVCADHFDPGLGVCAPCARDGAGRPDDGGSDDPDVDRYRF